VRSGSQLTPQILLWNGQKAEEWTTSTLPLSCLATAEPVRFLSDDKTVIAGFLFQPRAGRARRAAIAWVPENLASQFRPKFQREVQYLLERGFTVLAFNPRGSRGYGRAFLEADNGQQREHVREDLAAGMTFL